MQVFHKLTENNHLALALGYFDGVHLGHKRVIKSAVDYAQNNGKKSAVITFKDHPCCYFYGVCPKYILSRSQREEEIAKLGVDFLYELDFDETLAGLSAEEYLKDTLIKYFSPVAISTGFNHHFGVKKSGDAEFLRQNQTKYGYKYFEISPEKVNDKIISSTAIRTYLQQGKIEKANQMLGSNFSIKGEVVEGQKLGRTLGFRTANLLYPKEIIDIPFGVYKVMTTYGKGITNFGIRPTVSSTKKAVLETHILDFDKDIYNKTIRVEFLRMLRKEQKFNSVDELKKQIQSDIKSIQINNHQETSNRFA